MLRFRQFALPVLAVVGAGLLGGCWNREAVWEATDAHRASVVRPGESEPERLYRHGRDCMDTLERDDCAIDYFEQLIALEPDRRDLVADATFRLVELYRRHDKADDATLLLRKYWDLGMDYASAGVLPHGSRFAPAEVTTLFMVDVARLRQSGLHASLPQDAKDMMFTCDQARREQLSAEAKARREAREQAKLADMTDKERAEYEKRRKRLRFGRDRGEDQGDGDDGDEGETDEDDKTIYSNNGFCQLAAALDLPDTGAFDKFLGARHHADPSVSLAVVEVGDLETKLAAAVEAGRLVPEPTPAIEGRDLDAMHSIMRDRLRVWTIPAFEFDGEPAVVLSLDRDELTMAPRALVSGLLHARAHDETRLNPQLRELISQVPREVMFTTLVTPAAMTDFMSDMGAMGKLLPKANGVLIAAVVFDYAGLFVRIPTEDSVKAWLLLSIARKMIAGDDEGARAGNDEFMGNLDISQTRDGKALLMTNILTRNAITQMFLGG